MSDSQYINIGYTKKAHGLKGELKVHVEDKYLEDFLKNERIFIDVRGSKMPYFIAEVRGGGEMILSLEEVDNRDSAQALQSKGIFLRPQDLIPDHLREFEPVEEEVLEYAHLAGYTIQDQTIGAVGTIDEVLEMPQQEMAFLRFKGREVLVPLNAGLILRVDQIQRIVHMDLPEGLLDV
jgi:16S rRNA processing protein RimM